MEVAKKATFDPVPSRGCYVLHRDRRGDGGEVVGQRTLELHGILEARCQPCFHVFGLKTTGMAFWWIDLTTPLGSVVRKPYSS